MLCTKHHSIFFWQINNGSFEPPIRNHLTDTSDPKRGIELLTAFQRISIRLDCYTSTIVPRCRSTNSFYSSGLREKTRTKRQHRSILWFQNGPPSMWQELDLKQLHLTDFWQVWPPCQSMAGYLRPCTKPVNVWQICTIRYRPEYVVPHYIDTLVQYLQISKCKYCR